MDCIYISQERIVKKCVFVTFPLNPAALQSNKVRTNILTASIKTDIYHILQIYPSRTYSKHNFLENIVNCIIIIIIIKLCVEVMEVCYV
jgi:hypothetical protein